MSITQRVALRYKIAMSIGDPKAILDRIEEFVETRWKALEQAVPEAREGLRISLEYRGIRDIPPEVQAKTKVWNSNKYDFILMPDMSFKWLRARDAHELFLAILQQYSLPPALRKRVEAAAKFFGRSRINRPQAEEAIETFVKLMASYREYIDVAKQALNQGTSHTETVDTRIPAGPFTLVNTGGFSSAIMTEVAEVVEKAAQLMRGIGLGHVCYGEVLVSNTVSSKSNVLAFYLVEKDEVFVRANLKGKQVDTVRTMCHELGHRLEHKFLKDRARDIAVLYRRMSNDDHTMMRDEIRRIMDDPNLKPKVGDELVSNGKVYVIDGYDVNRNAQFIVKLYKKDEPTAKAHISLLGYAEIKGLLSTSGKFITPYAKKSPSENFAEMIAFHAMGKLPGPLVEMLEPLLK